MKISNHAAHLILILCPIADAARPTFHSRPSFLERRDIRNLEEEEVSGCDAAFLDCASDVECNECYESLENEGVDWATVDPMTICSDVLALLQDGGYCKNIGKNKLSNDIFCDTFDACLSWELSDDDDMDETEDAEEDEGVDKDILDCSALTTCHWDGMHVGFISDGTCQDFECYNTEVCNFDGGDCCEDKCQINVPFQYKKCGGEGYYCRDPSSAMCNTELKLTHECDKEKQEKPEKAPKCDDDESNFVLEMYDSWGDGWDQTSLTIYQGEEDVKIVYQGALTKGDHGKEPICLGTGCFHAKTGGGVWGNEVAWEIHTGKRGGGIPLASGGAPMDCTFSIGANVCENTCTGRVANAFDQARLSYDKLFQCISDKCMVPMGICRGDPDCVPCLQDETPSYCATNDNYNNLVDCTLCNCVPETPDYCAEKQAPKSSSKNAPTKIEKKDSNEGECNPTQTRAGSSAVMKFSTCTDVDQTKALLKSWDNNNFGALDEFEACSHTFNNEAAHGGKRALDCMRILETIANADGKEVEKDTDAIGASLYTDAENFCKCASASNDLCPSCSSFAHFKVLLFEVLDACVALDEIDCAAWSEFYQPCQDKIYDQFGNVDFNNNAQCEFVAGGCGSVGPFPAFRRLDCGGEIPKPAWDFYTRYSRGCVKNSDVKPSNSASSSSASKSKFLPNKPNDPKPKDKHGVVPPPPPLPPKPVVPYTPSSSSSNSLPSSLEPKPYVPYSAATSSSSHQTATKENDKKKSHYFLSFTLLFSIIAAGAYIYKKRNEDFDFRQYRRTHNSRSYDQSDGLYSGLTSSSSFEPPTLPPMSQESGMEMG